MCIRDRLEVAYEPSGLEISDGYLLDQERLYPKEVTVVGPATEMQSVEEAVVVRQFDNKPLSNSVTEELPVVLRSAGGETVTSPYFVLDLSLIHI